jgi:hypothetical protein
MESFREALKQARLEEHKDHLISTPALDGSGDSGNELLEGLTKSLNPIAQREAEAAQVLCMKQKEKRV